MCSFTECGHRQAVNLSVCEEISEVNEHLKPYFSKDTEANMLYEYQSSCQVREILKTLFHIFDMDLMV